MVQLLADPALSPAASPVAETPTGRQEETTMSREEHAQRMRDMNMKRVMKRAPRRGWSLTDYQDNRHDGSHAVYTPAAGIDRIPEHSAVPASSSTLPAVSSSQEQTPQQHTTIPQRPKLPPPRRSQSVTDKEPEPVNQPKPSCRLTLLDLPSELHYSIFDFLDPIDGACFGLTHPELYSIHRRKNGTVSLASRYSGPNDIEWAWRGATPLVYPISSKDKGKATAEEEKARENDLNSLRVKGQVYCRKCGISRCELHRHLKDWFGDEYEYCEIKKMYGAKAGPDAKAYCFMSSPKNPHRCGRHGSKKFSAVAAAAH